MDVAKGALLLYSKTRDESNTKILYHYPLCDDAYFFPCSESTETSLTTLLMKLPHGSRTVGDKFRAKERARATSKGSPIPAYHVSAGRCPTLSATHSLRCG